MKKAMAPVDILVVGAGPVGLAAALVAHRLGYRVALVAPARTAPDERTSALLAGSVALLGRIGVWERVKESAAPMRALRIVDATHRLIRAPEVTFHASEIDLDAFGYNLPNAALLDALESEAATRGIDRVPALVSSVRPDRDAIIAELSIGAEIAARLIVAADGRRSKIREGVGIATREWRYDQAALVVNFRHARPHDDISTEFHTEAGPFTLVPLAGRRSSLVWVSRPGDAERRSDLPDEALASEIEAQSSAILGAVAVDGPRQVFPLAGMNAARFGADRVVLAGEAAHLFPPIGAQGLNLGYRDVAAIEEILTGPLADPGATGRVAAYDRARRGDVLATTTAVDALNRTLLNGFLPVQALRGLGLFLLGNVPALRQAVMRQGVAAG
jgi:2-octaprenyl-6-methoxyphenol hydroxylase